MSDLRFLTFAEIHQRVNWPDTLLKVGIADTFLRDKHGPCPACGGTNRFRFDNKDGRGTFICSPDGAGCGAGDGFRLVELFHGCDPSTARLMVMEVNGLRDEPSGNRCQIEPIQPRRPTAAPAKLEWSSTAESIWRKTQGLRGTLGETYLLSRNCMLPPKDSHLRYLPPDGRYPPSLCAAITDAVTGTPLSLHFTRLAADGCGKAGTDQDKLLLKGHRKSGGVIRLWPDDAVNAGLGIGEGISTCLAAAHGFTPMWCVIDAGNLARFPILPGIEALTIFADNDPAGLRAARDCATRWAAVAEVTIAHAETPGEDFADLAAA
jgi:putative DNA primase/helicase